MTVAQKVIVKYRAANLNYVFPTIEYLPACVPVISDNITPYGGTVPTDSKATTYLGGFTYGSTLSGVYTSLDLSPYYLDGIIYDTYKEDPIVGYLNSGSTGNVDESNEFYLTISGSIPSGMYQYSTRISVSGTTEYLTIFGGPLEILS